MKASSSIDLENLKFWASTELTRAFTRLPSFWLIIHAPKLMLLSPDDVITPRHHDTSSDTQALVHVSDTSSATSAVSFRQHHVTELTVDSDRPDLSHSDLTREHFDC